MNKPTCTITIKMEKTDDEDGNQYAEVTNEIHAHGWKRKEVLSAFLKNIEEVVLQIVDAPNKLQ